MDTKSEQHSGNAGLVQKTEHKTKQVLTLLWSEIPAWLQDNHYIQRGYRPPSNSYQKSAASIGYLHNESVNIWTHLFGAVLAAVTGTIMYYFVRPRYKMATPEDVLVFSCFFLGAIVCLSLSTIYHTISNHSQSVAKFGNRLDYMVRKRGVP